MPTKWNDKNIQIIRRPSSDIKLEESKRERKRTCFEVLQSERFVCNLSNRFDLLTGQIFFLFLFPSLLFWCRTLSDILSVWGGENLKQDLKEDWIWCAGEYSDYTVHWKIMKTERENEFSG